MEVRAGGCRGRAALIGRIRYDAYNTGMAKDLVSQLIPFMGCVMERTREGLKLTGASQDHMMAVALTPKLFRPPFTVKAVAKTDSTNLRLYWHVGEIIFNWECSVRRLKVHDPETGCWHDGPDKGFIEPNQWHEIVWEIRPKSMRVLADGELRFEAKGKWGSIKAPVAIGPCFGSTVTVKAFEVK